MADADKATVTVEERLFLTADKEKVVKEGDPAAAFLFASPGEEIDAEEAKRYGLTSRKAAAKPEDKKAAAPANKARKATKK